RAIVTPSFVIVGAPHFLSMTTLRPLGPSVTLTALASASTPRSSDLRAESSNSSCLAMVFLLAGDARNGGRTDRTPARPRGASPGCGQSMCAVARGRSADDREDVTRGEDEVLLAAVLDLGAAVLAVDD